jgi:hypothetical protein
MVDTIATVAELQARLDWTLDSGEQGVAQGALDDLSDDARYYGSDTWDSTTAPRQVKSLILRAAARYMRNPDGYTQSRAGDETLMWADRGEEAGTAQFTLKEQQMLLRVSGRSTKSFGSAQVSAWGTRPRPRCREYYIPVDGTHYSSVVKDFPMYAENDPFFAEDYLNYLYQSDPFINMDRGG